MKKLFLSLLVIVAFTGLILAQSNTALTTQTGNAHQVDVTQTGSSNSSTVLQNGGDANRIGTPVTGDVGVDAGNFSLAKGLVQEGNLNVADITQTGNSNVIQQYRALRSVYNSLYQHGNSNDITIQQIGDNNVVGQAVFEYNSLEQVGNFNSAGIYQNSGSGNKLAIFYQHDNHNTANISQQGNANTINSATQARLGSVVDTYNQLTILQQGNHNTVDNAGELGDAIVGSVSQTGGDYNWATMQLSHSAASGDVNQTGNHNRATLTINMSYIGNGNTGVIHQTGDLNVATSVVGQTDPTVVSSNNNMETYQLGNTNYANTFLLGSSNNGVIDVTGDLNGTNLSPVRISETGLNNDGEITIVGNSNAAGIFQNGDLNSGTISQASNSNSAAMTQTGDSNIGTITQH